MPAAESAASFVSTQHSEVAPLTQFQFAEGPESPARGTAVPYTTPSVTQLSLKPNANPAKEREKESVRKASTPSVSSARAEAQPAQPTQAAQPQRAAAVEVVAAVEGQRLPQGAPSERRENEELDDELAGLMENDEGQELERWAAALP